jgi:hypothetical protein
MAHHEISRAPPEKPSPADHRTSNVNESLIHMQRTSAFWRSTIIGSPVDGETGLHSVAGQISGAAGNNSWCAVSRHKIAPNRACSWALDLARSVR